MELNIWIAFFAGIASFISPCCLPLYPSYLSYISGVSVSELKESGAAKIKLRALYHSIFFVLGFSIVFYSLGYGAGKLGAYFITYQSLISKISGILIIVFGLFLIGIFQPKFLLKERKLNITFKPAGYLGAFVIGIGFAAGWSPCVGPILGVIANMALNDPPSWFKYITAYSIGFAIPFLALAWFLGSVKWILKYSSKVMKIGGTLMIVMGILLYTEQMTKITVWLNVITPEWLKF